MRTRFAAGLIALIGFTTCAGFCQSVADSPQHHPLQLSAKELTEAYVREAHVPVPGAENFTFLVTHRDLNYQHGKLTSDRSTKSEQIFIAGLPYIRRIERDGKPLSGRDLQRETELYEAAVRDRTGLTEDERRKRLGQKGFASTQTIPLDHLETDFMAEIAGREQLGDMSASFWS